MSQDPRRRLIAALHEYKQLHGHQAYAALIRQFAPSFDEIEFLQYEDVIAATKKPPRVVPKKRDESEVAAILAGTGATAKADAPADADAESVEEDADDGKPVSTAQRLNDLSRDVFAKRRAKAKAFGR